MNWQCEVVGGPRDGDIVLVMNPEEGMLIDAMGFGTFRIEPRCGVLVAVWQGEAEPDDSEAWKG